MKLIIDIDEKKYEEIKRIAKAQFELTDKTEAQIIANGIPYEPKGDLISREALKETIIEPLNVNDAGKSDWYEGYYTAKNEDVYYIDNAPTANLDERVIQEVLNKRCMTAVANEYLIELHGKRTQGECKTCRHRDPEDKKCDCGAEIEVEDPIDDKFCFNCGAQMQKGDAE